jgi:hypothetical protein
LRIRCRRECLDLKWKREQKAGELLNKKHHNLNSSPNIIKVIMSRMMRWAVHVALMGEKCIQLFGKGILRKETARKTSVYVEILY